MEEGTQKEKIEIHMNLLKSWVSLVCVETCEKYTTFQVGNKTEWFIWNVNTTWIGKKLLCSQIFHAYIYILYPTSDKHTSHIFHYCPLYFIIIHLSYPKVKLWSSMVTLSTSLQCSIKQAAICRQIQQLFVCL